MMLRLLDRLVRATPARWRTLVCLALLGHLRRLDPHQLCTVCDVCGATTPGVDVSAPAYHLTHEGDPRRVQAYARKGIVRPEPRPLPEPVHDDFWSNEHFQGGHARVI